MIRDMLMRRLLPVSLILCVGWAVSVTAAVTKTFTIQEPFSQAWGPDRVNYRVEFPQGEVVPAGIALRDAAGNAVPAQLSDITWWPDNQTVKSATLSFMASLQPDAKGVWTLAAGRDAVVQPASDLAVKEGTDAIELTTGKSGIRLIGGAKTFPAPVAAEQIPAPIQGLRLRSGQWIGRGWWQTDRPCLGYSAKVIAKGPVFARVALKYDFADNTSYTATVDLNSNQELAVVSEAFNLSQGKRYEMPELGGVKPGQTFQYVMPHFKSKTDAMMWDWWCPTGGAVPSPNCYNFSFYAGLQPDSAEFAGRNPHQLVKNGPKGIEYTANSRMMGINAYTQWVGDEALYFGAYNSQHGTDEVAIVGLRPSQWVHPDIDPHPVQTLNQYVQTNNLWVERRTNPDIFLRAATCLGKRVYGIGVVQRDAQGSNLMLKHLRLGRLELDRVKDWVLDYNEPSKYPRLFVKAGDLEGMRKRGQKNLADQQHIRWIRYLNDGNPATGKQLIDECMKALQEMTTQYATDEYGHMNYAIMTGVLAHQVDIALAVPEITPEQRAKILHHVAANLYQSLSPDYVPPREAGYAWGSANMQSQLRARGGLMASLLPNHPEGKAWRSYLTEWISAYTESQVNPAGATLECPHYGGMAIELGVVPLMAMANCGDADLTAAINRYRAAAELRLGTLLPWDVRGNMRSYPPIGDGYYDSDGTLSMLAALLEKTDPALAKGLQWGINESGRTFGGHPTPTGVLLDPDKEAAVPELGSKNFPGFGFVMRNGFPSRNETFLLATAGGFSVGHGHSDRGAFIFYAKGAPVMVDFAGMYTPSFGQAWEHAGGLTINHNEAVKPCPGKGKDGCFYTGKVWVEHTTEPFTSLEPGWDPQAKDLDEAFGKVTRFATTPVADYAEMSRRINYLNRVAYMLPETHNQLAVRSEVEDVWAKQPFTWTRRYVLVKSADLSHDYLVIRDDLAGNTEFNPALNLWALADKLEAKGQIGTYTGQHGVDLDCYVAEPKTFNFVTHKIGHTAGFAFSRYYEKTFAKKFAEDQLLFQIPQQSGKGGYFVALVPRMHADTAPTFATVLNGNGIKVTFTDRTDTVVLLNQPGETRVGGLTLQGTAFLVSTMKGKTTVTLLAPGKVLRGRKVLLSGDTAATLVLKQ
ncbi:MAG: heparinase II/III domain-containing protein [Armatimonadota bacterium]